MEKITGRQFTIKPEFQDAGDDKYTWTAFSEANPSGWFKARITGPDTTPTYTDVQLKHVAEFK